MKISIVIPVYNSGSTISPLVDSIIEQITKYTLEIILVNDYSQDNSEAVCIDIYNKYKGQIKFYSLGKNVGEHNAVMAGLNNVTGEYAVIMDDDFQNGISEVIKLIDYAAATNHDVIYTWYEHKKHSFLRNLGSKFNDKVANIMINKPTDLYLSSFKALHKDIIHEIIKYDLPFPYIDGLILRTTRNIGKLKVEHSERMVGRSNYTLRKLIMLWLNMFTSFSILPLRLSVFLGFFMSFAGFAFAFVVLIWKFIDSTLPMGYASLMTAIILFSGIQLIAIGMMGEYIGRIFMSQNKQPQFFIRKKFE